MWFKQLLSLIKFDGDYPIHGRIENAISYQLSLKFYISTYVCFYLHCKSFEFENDLSWFGSIPGSITIKIMIYIRFFFFCQCKVSKVNWFFFIRFILWHLILIQIVMWTLHYDTNTWVYAMQSKIMWTLKVCHNINHFRCERWFW